MSRFIFWSLVTLVVLAPFPLASNRPGPWSALALAVAILLVLWSIVAVRRRPRGARRADRMLLPIAAVFLVATGWMLLSTTGPLPADWQPETLRRAGDLLGAAPPAGIGLNAGGAWHVLMRLATYGGVFLLAWEFGRNRDRAQSLLAAIVIAGVAYAVYGLVIHLGDFKLVLWYPKTAYGDGLTSTFINRNSYATYAALGLLTALALMFSEWRQRAGLRGSALRAPDPRARGASDLRLGALALAAGVMAAALILTGSRGGFYSLAATLAICVLLLALARLLRGWRLIGIVGLGAVAGVVLLIAVGGGLAARLGAASASVETSRGDIFRPTIEAIRARPLAGYGAGSFQGVFETVNDGALYRQGYYIDKAHNTYLELALEAGIPAAAALFACVFAFAALCALALLRRKGVRFALAGTAASLMVGIHALVDFSLQMPAVAVTYAALLGVAAAQSLRRLEPGA